MQVRQALCHGGQTVTLDKCKQCESHILYRDGFVLCKFHNITEQRTTTTGDNNIIYIIACPGEEEVKDYKKIFPPRWGK